jgi:TorA maturation chaperone TorD
MRDPGLDLAISAVGSVSELARRLGISQPSVSNWSRVPAERVLQVESISGVSRSVLRPDLYGGEAESEEGGLDEVDVARAREYAMLAALLIRAPDADFLKQIASLTGDATPFGLAHRALAEAAAHTNAADVEDEYFNLFIGVGRGELLPYASYYLTGFLHERPLAQLREDLDRLGIARSEGNAEPEDHAAILCEIMAGLIEGRFPAPAGSDRAMFEKHLVPWIGRFFNELEQAKGAVFYRPIGMIGRLFMQIEREAFAMQPE